jgi:hypothetical protein
VCDANIRPLAHLPLSRLRRTTNPGETKYWHICE